MAEAYLSHVSIKNIKGIESLEFDLGAVTVISGRNGLGKSTVLGSIKTIFEGGSHPSWVRNAEGVTKGEIILDLSDGTKIKKILLRNGYDLNAKTPTGGKIEPPKRYVEQLARGFSFDPLKFIGASKKDKIEFMVAASGMTFTPDELREILPAEHVPAGEVNLAKYNEIRGGVYGRRKAINVVCRDIEGNIRTHREWLSGGGDEDWPAKATELQSEITTLRETLASATADMDAQRERLRMEANARADAKIREIQTALAGEIEKIDSDAEKVYRDGAAETQAALESLTAEHATAAQKASEAERQEGIRQSIKQLETKLDSYDADTLTYQLEQLDKLKREKLAASALPGVDIDGDKITIEGIPWDDVCTSDQYISAIQICAQQVGPLGLMVCDDSNHIDPIRWKEFLAALKESGLRAIVARATGDDLMVEVK